jgi:hypothetical protein
MLGTLLSLAALPAPVAYVLEHEDQWTKSAHASRLLRAAGFEVEPLPLEILPTRLADGVIVLGSFSGESEGAAAYLSRNARSLQEWVARGNVLVQFTQTDQSEPSPVFLPQGLAARRADPDFGATIVVDREHTLLAGIGGDRFAFHATRTVWETFEEQRGFHVLMAAPDGERPSLMEGQHGKGRIVLSSLALDKTIEPAEGRSPEADATLERFRTVLFRNLVAYVEDVRAGRLGDVRPTPSQADLRAVERGSWSLIALPDTQIYAESYPGLFLSQTAWIALNKERLGIKYVLQLGDITNRNTHEQWKVAREAMSLLDGVVPYAIAPGNHDFGPGGNAKTRETFLNEYFPFEDHYAMPTFGGAYRRGQLENTYHLFEAGGRKWIVIALEWGPRESVVHWADEVMDRHKDRTGILITHAYMYSDSTRYDWRKYADHQHWNPHAYGTEGGVNDGEDLWQKLVSRHNFALALNGHVLNDGTGYMASKNALGYTVHQVLANYQFRTLGGEGYLRILEFSPDGETVRIKAYSTLYDRFMTAPDQSFVVRLDQPIGPVLPLRGLRARLDARPTFGPSVSDVPRRHAHGGRMHAH